MRHLPSVQIFHQPMDILMASLILADTIHGIGTVMSLKWVQAGKVETGNFCTAQGIIISVGSAGVAFSSLAIAVYTFLGVWVSTDISMQFTLGVVATVWSFITLLVVVAMEANHGQPFMAPAPYWCWVRLDIRLNGWKYALQYAWEWASLGISSLIYISLYLWMRGNLAMDETAWWRFHFKFSPDKDPETLAMRRKSLVMLAYPAVYSVIVPLSAIRWIKFDHPAISIPSAATFGVMSFASLLGLFDVILLLKTKRSSGLFGRLMFPARPPSLHEQHEEVETMGTGLGRLP